MSVASRCKVKTTWRYHCLPSGVACFFVLFFKKLEIPLGSHPQLCGPAEKQDSCPNVGLLNVIAALFMRVPDWKQPVSVKR